MPLTETKLTLDDKDELELYLNNQLHVAQRHSLSGVRRFETM